MVKKAVHAIGGTGTLSQETMRTALEVAEEARELPSFSEIVSCIEGALSRIDADWRVDTREMHAIASAIQRLYDPPFILGWDDKTEEWALTTPDGSVKRAPGTPEGYEELTGEKP
jgi:hypothetical protein